MEAATGVEAFLADPDGKYLAGRTWVAFSRDARLSGVVLWGRPDREDAERLLEVMPAAGSRSPLASRRRRLIDLRRLEVPDADALEVFLGYLDRNQQVLVGIVEQLAIIRSPGLGGTLAAGAQPRYRRLIACSSSKILRARSHG
jgi:hypothetical protein